MRVPASPRAKLRPMKPSEMLRVFEEYRDRCSEFQALRDELDDESPHQEAPEESQQKYFQLRDKLIGLIGAVERAAVALDLPYAKVLPVRSSNRPERVNLLRAIYQRPTREGVEYSPNLTFDLLTEYIGLA
jgi:hypothetical protein